MPKLQFSVNIPSSPEVLINEMTNFGNWKRYFKYLTNVEVIEEKENRIKTKELISFNFHKLSHKIDMMTIILRHDNSLDAEIISGPLKDSILKIKFESIDIGSKVSVDANWKVSLKYRFLTPIIKPRLKNSIIAILYKIHTNVLEGI